MTWRNQALKCDETKTHFSPSEYPHHTTSKHPHNSLPSCCYSLLNVLKHLDAICNQPKTSTPSCSSASWRALCCWISTRWLTISCWSRQFSKSNISSASFVRTCGLSLVYSVWRSVTQVRNNVKSRDDCIQFRKLPVAVSFWCRNIQLCASN